MRETSKFQTPLFLKALGIAALLLLLAFWLIWDLVLFQQQLIQGTDFIDAGTGFIPNKKLHQQKVRLQQRQKGQSSPSPKSQFSSKAISSIQVTEVLNDIEVSELLPYVDVGDMKVEENLGSDLDFSAFDLSDLVDRLRLANAKKGKITFSLIWDNFNDLDLHCEGPEEEYIYFGNKKGKYGELDVDMNAGGPDTDEPVENLYYDKPIKGEYKVYVHHYANHGDPDPTKYLAWIRIAGRPEKKFKGSLRHGQARKLIYTFRIIRDME